MQLKQYPADRIRNVGLFSHGGAGKTSLAEALLFDSGATTRLGRVEEGNTVIVGPGGNILAGPVRHREATLVVDLDLRAVAAARRLLDPVGHYNRPDVFRLHVDTSSRPSVVVADSAFADDRRRDA